MSDLVVVIFRTDNDVAVGPHADGGKRSEVDRSRHNESVSIVGVFADYVYTPRGSKDARGFPESCMMQSGGEGYIKHEIVSRESSLVEKEVLSRRALVVVGATEEIAAALANELAFMFDKAI